jgi:hypothetical protein
MGNPKNNSVIVAILTARIAAILKYLTMEKAAIPVNGTLMTPGTLAKLYQRNLKARGDVAVGQAAHKSALKARDEAEVERLAADENLKAWVLGRYGAGSAEAGEFGFAPRKVATVSAATRARAVEQSKATREARGTVGKKKKLAIKGVIPTSTAPAAPATPSVTAPANAVVALPALLTAAPAAAAATQATPPVLVPAAALANAVSHA